MKHGGDHDVRAWLVKALETENKTKMKTDRHTVKMTSSDTVVAVIIISIKMLVVAAKVKVKDTVT